MSPGTVATGGAVSAGVVGVVSGGTVGVVSGGVVGTVSVTVGIASVTVS